MSTVTTVTVDTTEYQASEEVASLIDTILYYVVHNVVHNMVHNTILCGIQYHAVML